MHMRALHQMPIELQQRMSRSYFGPGPIWQTVSSSPAQGKGAACGHRLTTAVLFAAFVSGCATESAPQPPAVTPAAFEHRTMAAGAAWPAQDWYHGFGSDELNALVDEAVRDNTDLTGARERVAQADARARQAGAPILPKVSVDAMLSASYEVDFWGKNRAAANSARLQAGASRAERDTVALTLLGGVASQYFQVLALRERLAVARANRDAAKKILEAIQARFDAGVASPTELSSQKAAWYSAQIAISDLEQLEMEARAALAVLLGRPPENFEIRANNLDSLREPVVAAGLPSELLTRRPDLVVAEANLRAAHANLAAARAAMFPSLTLTAAAGVQNPALPATVLTIPGVGPSYSAIASLTQPIFDHGRLAAQRDEALAKEQELLATYRAAIIASLVDVEKALAAVQHLEAVREFQQGSVTESERAFEGAQLRYQRGSGDFLTLLESQRTLYAARDQYAQYRLARLQALVALCKALGGGWSGSPGATPEPQAAPAAARAGDAASS
jgi:NodT family efflux transporter outer membrane factor (OMF) lipoprotein